MAKLFTLIFCALLWIHSPNGIADASAKLNLTPIKGHLSLLTNKGGNIAISQGEDGLLIIDNGYKDQGKAVSEQLKKLGKGQDLNYIINTHWHGDHSGANERLGKSATIIAHDNVRKRLNAPQSIPILGASSKAYEKSGLPSLTYPESMHVHFNQDTLRLQHYPGGHTDGDTVVFFEKANVVHMGDLLFYPRFPFIDVENNGNAVAYAKNVQQIIRELNDDTIVIPGHGPLTNKDGVKRFHDMMIDTIATVRAMKEKGLSKKQAQQQKLNKKWQSWGEGFINEKTWIGIIYDSL